MKRAVEIWNAYWFRPASLVNLAMCRLAIVGFQERYWLLHMDYQTRFLRSGAAPDEAYSPVWVMKLLMTPFGSETRPGLEFMAVVFWLSVVAGFFALIGFRTQIALAIFATGNIFMQAYRYSLIDYHHPEALLAIALCLLAISPCGRRLSVDAWLAGRAEEKSEFAGWPLRVIQLLFALIYFNAAWSKFARSGLDWLNGYTLQYHMLQGAERWGSALGLWLGHQQTLLELLSWGAFAFEATFFVVLIVPALALLYVPIGAVMHTVIYFTLGAPFFHYIALYAVFVPWSRLLDRVGLLRRQWTRPSEAHVALESGGQGKIGIR